MMTIYKRYKARDAEWKLTTETECLGHTEGAGYWKKGTVLDMLKNGSTVVTPFVEYKADELSIRGIQ